MGRFATLALALGIAFSALSVAAGPAAADYKPQERYYRHHEPFYNGNGEEPMPGEVFEKRRRGKHGYRWVYAESWYGFKRVVAPVRRAPLGYQVRLPGGTWVYCEYSCEYTLRKMSLDFWDNASGQGSNVSPRILYWEFGF